MPNALRSLPWSLQGRFLKKSSNIMKIFTWEWRSLVISVEFMTKLMLNSETNLTCILLHHNAINMLPWWRITGTCACCVTVCDRWLISHNQRSPWLGYMFHIHVGKEKDHVIWHVHDLMGGESGLFLNIRGNQKKFLTRDQTQVECWSWHTSPCMLCGDPPPKKKISGNLVWR